MGYFAWIAGGLAAMVMLHQGHHFQDWMRRLPPGTYQKHGRFGPIEYHFAFKKK